MNYISCHACGRALKGIDRHRMLVHAQRIFCDTECLDWYNAQQERIFGEHKRTDEPRLPICDE